MSSKNRSLTIKVEVPEEQLQISIDNAIAQAMSATVQRKIDARLEVLIEQKMERLDKQLVGIVESAVKSKVREYGYVDKTVREVAGELIIRRIPQLGESV